MVERAQDFPATWALATLGAVTTKPQYGWTTKATDVGNNLKLLRTSDISTGRVNWKTVPTCVNEPDDPRKFFLNAGDIVVARAGSVGKPFLIREDVTDAVFASYLVRFTPKILPEYINFFMQSRRYWEQIEDKSSGIAIPNVNASKLSQVEMAVAPLNEQRRIVDKIESLFTQIDHGEASLRDVQKLLARYRQSVLKAAITGQLTADWRAENADCLESGSDLLDRILQARRENWQGRGKYKEPVAPDTNDLPELPEGWIWVTLGALVKNGPQNGVYFPQSKYGSGTPILRIDDYQIGWIRSLGDLRVVGADCEEVDKYSLETGDFVVNRVNSVSHLGKVALVSKEHEGVLFESNMMRFSVSFEISKEYLYFYLSSLMGKKHLIKNCKHAVNQASINQGDVSSTPVPLPPLLEQEEIAQRLAEESSRELSTKHWCQTELTRSASLRQSILKDAFAGRLVPQDPDDEPASELLARIRAERDAAAPKKRTRKKVTA